MDSNLYPKNATAWLMKNQCHTQPHGRTHWPFLNA